MDYIHEIIRRYFNNRYSKTLETKIQHWLKQMLETGK